MLKIAVTKFVKTPHPKKQTDNAVRAGYVTTNKMSIFSKSFSEVVLQLHVEAPLPVLSPELSNIELS